MFMCALRASLLLLLATRSALAQTSETAKDATGQDSTQQPLQQRPQVFFPTAEQPKMEMHHHGNIHEVMPKFPRLGNSQRVVSGSILLLEELEQMAIAHNPTLAQTRRAIEAARGRELQRGLYPNPVIGYRGDEIRGGSFGGGEQGFFVEQPIILGGKLGLNRKVGAAAVKEHQAEAEAQQHRVENDVRMAYYRVLAAQERLALERDLVGIAQSNVRVARQLENVGQADETEVLEAETEEQRMEIAAGIAEAKFKRQWTMLISAVGISSIPEGGVAGRLDTDLPSLDSSQLLRSLLAESPEVKSAQASVERSEVAVLRATHESIPDITVRAGMQQNYEQINRPDRRVGLQGFAEIGLHLHLWDRNQGGVAAERANLGAAKNEISRVDLMLRDRFAMYTEDYSSARFTAERYRTEILPRLEHAYKLMTEQYGLMTASFIRVLMLQRMLYENETAYVDALERTWTSSVALSGYLLEGSLAASPSMDMQSQVSQPAQP
jgi:cobalt-zinc-cadmium efflux system outer membrane protein